MYKITNKKTKTIKLEPNQLYLLESKELNVNQKQILKIPLELNFTKFECNKNVKIEKTKLLLQK